MGISDEAIDHPSLAKYPDSPATLCRVDGVLYRVPLIRDRDEAVPVPVNDLVAASAAIHRFTELLSSGAGSAWDISILGDVLVAGTNEDAPRGRQEVCDHLGGLSARLNEALPYW